MIRVRAEAGRNIRNVVDHRRPLNSSCPRSCEQELFWMNINLETAQNTNPKDPFRVDVDGLRKRLKLESEQTKQ